MKNSLNAMFRLEMQSMNTQRHHTAQSWYVRDSAKHKRVGHGAPTAANLAMVVDGYERSTAPGFPNAHLGPDVIGYARIVRQSTGETVAEYERPNVAPEFIWHLKILLEARF